jgi:diadenosine tetraphosphate (Ap4A) HIT family hydrolase
VDHAVVSDSGAELNEEKAGWIVLGCAKVNFASIGNVVPQLHLHIVGRTPTDPCWPAPVWGNLRETRD